MKIALAQMSRLLLALGLLGSPAAALEFTVTDITGWSQAQLDGLPFFHDWVPFRPVGAAPTMSLVARTTDTVIGNIQYNNVFVQQVGARVLGGSQQIIGALGTFNWSNNYWDGQDWHFSNGFVNDASLHDLNTAGLIVGTCTVSGGGNAPYQAIRHAVLWDPATQALQDLSPGATQAAATAINDEGLIAGTLNMGSGTLGFRRRPDGGMTLLGVAGQSLTPQALNDNGWMAGIYQIYPHWHAFLSYRGDQFFDLGMPDQGSPDMAGTASINSWGQVVGATWQANNPSEPNACLWQRDAGGIWSPTDLNEMLANGGNTLEQGLAINDEGYIIARGHPGGGNVPGSNLYLLTPDALNPPWPTPAAMTLQIQAQGGSNCLLSWNDAGSGWSYTVENCAELSAAQWVPLAGQTWPTTALSLLLSLDPQSEMGFFRVVARFGEL